MSPLHPSKDALQGMFYSSLSATNHTPYQARAELFPIHSSVVEDAKGKAKKLSAEATAEFEKASAKAQAKTGKIELYSGRYYTACTFGGLMACVRGFSPIWKHAVMKGWPFKSKHMLTRSRDSPTLL